MNPTLTLRELDALSLLVIREPRYRTPEVLEWPARQLESRLAPPGDDDGRE